MPRFCNACGHSNPDGSVFCGKCGLRVAQPDIDEPEQLDLTGHTLNGRYRVDGKLGQGGMGAVFRATDLRLTREVALKVLSPELVAHPTARRRMTQEANALARIEHPNVVRLFDVFDEGHMFVMVLELVTGGYLRRRIQSQGLPEAEALRLMEGILEGLHAIHEAGLVHRDVKPENVLMTQKQVPKLADLGVARDASGAGKTRIGARLGTPEYMSPEQAQGFPVDHRSDLFSAGVVFYELICGVRPFAGHSELDVMSAVVHQPPDLRKLDGRVTPLTRAAIEALLQKDPNRRVASAADAAAALGMVVGTERVRPQSAPKPKPVPVAHVHQAQHVTITESEQTVVRPMQFATPKKTTYFTSEGRIGRQEYLKTAVLLPFATIVAVAMLTALDKNVGVLFVIGVGLPVLGMTILATMRRFHDLGYSGAWVLPCMIPYIGWIGLIALCVAPGAVGVNRFGADPIQR